MTIELIPAIDLKEGACVRLKQGRMEDSDVFSTDVPATARHWYDMGAMRLHIVDLDGAFAGQPKNKSLIEEVTAALPDLSIQIGGGIRDLQTIEHYIASGVQWCIIGSQAVKEPSFVREACTEFPGKIIVGLDAKDGWVAIHGWSDVTTIRVETLAKEFADDGIEGIIFTDIGRDGMMTGVNIDATNALAKAAGVPIIASGGLADMADIEQLAALDAADNHGIVGAITGRAIYEGSLDYRAARKFLAGEI